jgi:hypothetical protein
LVNEVTTDEKFHTTAHASPAFMRMCREFSKYEHIIVSAVDLDDGSAVAAGIV